MVEIIRVLYQKATIPAKIDKTPEQAYMTTTQRPTCSAKGSSVKETKINFEGAMYVGATICVFAAAWMLVTDPMETSTDPKRDPSWPNDTLSEAGTTEVRCGKPVLPYARAGLESMTSPQQIGAIAARSVQAHRNCDTPLMLADALWAWAFDPASPGGHGSSLYPEKELSCILGVSRSSLESIPIERRQEIVCQAIPAMVNVVRDYCSGENRPPTRLIRSPNDVGEYLLTLTAQHGALTRRCKKEK